MVSDFAAALRELRRAAGLSHEALARRVKVAKSYIGLIENDRRLPHSDLIKALDAALEASGRLVALADAQRDQRRTMEDVDRRDVLKSIVAGTAEMAVRPRSGQAQVQHLLARTARLRRLDDTLGGADTYGLYLREMRATRSVIGKSSYSEITGKALLQVLAEQAQLAGWAAFDAGWTSEAHDLFTRSKTWAQEAGSTALVANALALLAYQQAFTATPNPQLAAASYAHLAADTPNVVQALVYERAAWSFAVAGQRAAADRALDAACTRLADPGDTAPPDWTIWVDSTELQIMSGRCHAALGGGSQAVEALDSALAGFPDEYARDKSLYSLALARAYIHAGHIEQATATIARSAELAAGVASRRPAVHIRQTMRLLSPYANEPAVVDLRERLRLLAQLELSRPVDA